MEKLKAFVHKNPARIAAFISSAVALLVSALFPEMPTESAVILVLSALGLGEYAQRVEDKKTELALYTDVEDLDEEE
jgi:hypothetical protein